MINVSGVYTLKKDLVYPESTMAFPQGSVVVYSEIVERLDGDVVTTMLEVWSYQPLVQTDEVFDSGNPVTQVTKTTTEYQVDYDNNDDIDEEQYYYD